MAKKIVFEEMTPVFRFVRRMVLLLVFTMVTLTSILVWPRVNVRMQSEPLSTSLTFQGTLTPTFAEATELISSSVTPPPLASLSLNAQSSITGQGLIVLAIDEGGFSHLFALCPGMLPLTRLTDGAWDDITPALSPDGSRLAFASNRDGYWDLYLLELGTGQITRLTNTPAYDASPSWSPDGLWMAYETYVDDFGGNLEVNILSLKDAQTPMRLTEDPAADFAPAWSPQGRQIAFVSTRSGQKEIWLADLNQVENRFRNLGHSSSLVNDHPVWSPDGNWLAWSASVDGTQTILVLDNTQPDARPRASGSGDWPAWSPAGDVLVTSIDEPNKTYLTGYNSQSPGLALSPLSLNGSLHGLSWGNTSLIDHILAVFAQIAQVTPAPIWQPALHPVEDMPAGRQRLIPLNDVEAPNPSLQDLVDESFQALRQKVAQVAGWDFLSSLENAYVPLTSPLAPGMNEDWLFTGRAFAINPLPVNAGWVVIAREDFGARTYWRIYLKARFQDGSQGMPLHELPWDLSARFGGNPRFYEQGGELMKSVPVGYWVDFTQQAIAFGWERQSALSTWRQVFATTRFNEFALTDGLAWITAMEEIYPAEALVTLTPPPPPSDTPTASPIPTRTPVPTRTPWLSPTPRPTRTPWPTATSKPTRTPRITASPTVLPAATETIMPLTPQ